MDTIHELNQNQMEAYPPCVLHGNPQIASLRCDARGITAWLDWENSAVGDPRWDVACVMNELQIGQKHSWADRFCEAYTERTGTQLHNVAYWQVLAATQRWATTRQMHPTGESLPVTQLERIKKQTWTALAHLRNTRIATTQPET
jgi:aminoglycoside phosphotransferase (APT) family kinase protein